MIRKSISIGVVVLSLGSYLFFSDRIIKIRAQALPITRTATWDANPANENVTNYTVTLDGAAVGNPTGNTQQVVFTTVGMHELKVTATNLWGTSTAATLNINVIVPTSPKNTKIQ